MSSETLSLITIPLFSGAIGYVDELERGRHALLPGALRRAAGPRTGAARAPAPAAHPADPGVHAGRPGLAGHHSLARGEDGQPRGGQGDRQARQRGRLLRAARLRGARRAPDRLDAAATSASIVERIDGARAPARCGATSHRGCARRCTRASSAQLPDIVRDDHRRDRRQHRPAARRQAHGDPAHGGAPRALQPRLPRGRRARSCASSSTSASSSGSPLGIPTAFLTEFVLTQWWVLPICGVIIGYTTNLLAIKMIFEPVECAPVRALPVPGPLPAPPARGGRGLRGDHRRRHRHARATSARSCCTGRARTARAR